MASRTLTPSEIASLANALQAAATRWNDWADELALPQVAQTFRDQAHEALTFANDFMAAKAVTIRA